MLKTKDGEVLSSNEHQCGAPDDAHLEVQKTINRAKKRAREEDTSISKIYSEDLSGLHNRCCDFVTEIPEQQVMKRTLYNHRAKSRGNKKESKSSREVVLQAEILTMNDGSSFLLKDDNVGDRITISSGNAGREALKSKQYFFYGWNFQKL